MPTFRRRTRDPRPRIVDDPPPELAFGVVLRQTRRGKDAFAYGPDGRQCGRTLRSITDQQLTDLLDAITAQPERHAQLELPRLFEEACAVHPDTTGTVRRFRTAARTARPLGQISQHVRRR